MTRFLGENDGIQNSQPHLPKALAKTAKGSLSILQGVGRSFVFFTIVYPTMKARYICKPVDYVQISNHCRIYILIVSL